ncbi:vacuolar protein sorting-associated protein, putative [Entamoeba histolytica HM-3:IMSS]|uniref:Vacuolar protein sorting-associated protein, putative n=2 Tax=Entamoeba histolytica TaxID=5759 RepID=M2QK43_ENTHI|nr:vacuolar protein sorting-associated protein, putative [Entamoeba histolytica KU27]EMS11751.1 vacuolar protein sorting-associated protein, putative [Entamoeba histolytica HM-3:IMSS]
MNLSGVYGLKEKQKEVLINVLERKIRQAESTESKWKLLVFDKFCSELIESHFVVSDLRKNGVTMILNIENQRQKIDDVEAIYIIQPTKKNIEIICQDIQNELYESFSLCFSNELSQKQMKYLAKEVVQLEKIYKIKDVINGCFNFQIPEYNLINFSMEHSYSLFNNPTISDEMGMKLINYIVDSLFTIIYTMKEIPIIRTRTSSTEQVIGEKLVKKIRDFMKKEEHYFIEKKERTLFIISNRNYDLSQGLMHGWSYQSLIKETQKMNGMKVDLNNTTEYIDSDGDIWTQCKEGIISDVADTIIEKTKQLEQVKYMIQQENNRLFNNGNIQINEGLYTMSKKLEHEIDLHTTIAQAVLKSIQERSIDLLFSYEDNIMSHIKIEKTALLELIKKLDNKDDIIRLYYVCLLNNFPVDEINQLMNEKQIDLKELKYIEHLKQMQEYLHVSKKNNENSFSVTSMVGTVLGKVAKLLPSDKKVAATIVVDTLSNAKGTDLEKEFNYFDPIKSEEPFIPEKRHKHTDVILFMLGGGNYMEYTNICQFAKKSNKRIIYATTEMLNGTELLHQISRIA